MSTRQKIIIRDGLSNKKLLCWQYMGNDEVTEIGNIICDPSKTKSKKLIKENPDKFKLIPLDESYPDHLILTWTPSVKEFFDDFNKYFKEALENEKVINSNIDTLKRYNIERFVFAPEEGLFIEEMTRIAAVLRPFIRFKLNKENHNLEYEWGTKDGKPITLEVQTY